MKRVALALLLGAALVFAIASLLETRYPWLGYVRAAAEAAVVGGVADWFAVTALFRHPLGIPIPHTAIVPARKDRIGRTLGVFVQANFLSRDAVSAKLEALRIGEKAALWLSDPDNSRSLARGVAKALSGAAVVLRDEDVQAFIDRAISKRAQAVRIAPLTGRVLELLTADGRHQELLDHALALVARVVQENEELIRDRVHAETPWWMPGVLDARIQDRIVDAISRTLADISASPTHPLRVRFDAAVHDFIERLQSSPATIARAEALKEELLAHPAVRDFTASIWGDVKRKLRDYADRPPDAPAGGIERAFHLLGETIRADPALAEKVDAWLTGAVLYAVEQSREEVGHLIAQTVEAWDPYATSHRIELQIGRDLQFIRVNGTIVGGLVGLVLYTIGRLL